MIERSRGYLGACTRLASQLYTRAKLVFKAVIIYRGTVPRDRVAVHRSFSLLFSPVGVEPHQLVLVHVLRSDGSERAWTL